MLSSDPDGDITAYEWNFGDGSNGTGESVPHTYTTAGIFPVVLRVTDDGGAQDTAQKTVTVSPGGGNGGGATGPTATFTATPLVGAAPLTVTFNASASSYEGHAITYYSWDFGDGVTGTGITTIHTYSPATTTTYHVVLRIIASDNTEDTATRDITVTTSTPTPPSAAPTASFTSSPNTGTAPKEIEFDPSFGDQSSQTETSDKKVTHKFVTAQSSQNFTVTLTVIDDHGLTHAASRTVTIENRAPIAGFEVSVDGGITWKVEDVQTSGKTITVHFRSVAPDWSNLSDPADKPNESTKKPVNFESSSATPARVSGDRNLSYDPEGEWVADDGWGIGTYTLNFGDGTANVPFTSPFTTIRNGTFSHTFTTAQTQQTFTVILTVTDELGASGSYSRQVKLGQ
jgi:PKD repeat protein